MADNDDSAIEADPQAPEPKDASRTQVDRGSPASIFVSYRVVPDQPVAEAFKKLVEAVLEPAPDVFVAGLGGLRASNLGFKPQLQNAARRATAFVSLLTPASRDREWIIYEAGAAWGRARMFVPLLVNLEMSDMPAIVADSQAFRASDADDVKRLLTDLAEECGCTVKSALCTRRVKSFQALLEKYAKAATETASASSDENDPLEMAVSAAMSGNTVEADEMFARLERDARSPDDVMRLRGLKIFALYGENTTEALKELELVEAPLKDTAQYSYWCSNLEPNPAIALEHLKEAHRRSKLSQAPIPGLARKLSEALDAHEHSKEAVDVLFDALRSGDRRLCAEAAGAFCNMPLPCQGHSKLLFAVLHASVLPSEMAFEKATGVAEELELKELRLHFARELDTLSGDGTTANELGRAYSTMGWRSLAYRAFRDAAKKGASVGLINAASLLSEGAVDAAGLDLLGERNGTFEAADPAFPHQTLARMEEAVSKEASDAKEAHARGEKLFRMLSEFAHRAVLRGGIAPETGSVALTFRNGDRQTLPIETGMLGAMGPLKERPAAVQCYPIVSLRRSALLRHEETHTVLMGWCADGSILGLEFESEGHFLILLTKTFPWGGVHASEGHGPRIG